MRMLCYGDSNTYGYDPRGFFGDRFTEAGHRAFAEGLYTYLTK